MSGPADQSLRADSGPSTDASADAIGREEAAAQARCRPWSPPS